MAKAMICGSWGGAACSVAQIVAPRGSARRSRATWPEARTVSVCPSSWIMGVVRRKRGLFLCNGAGSATLCVGIAVAVGANAASFPVSMLRYQNRAAAYSGQMQLGAGTHWLWLL